MSEKIITLSRQFGSGGHTIGNQIAKELGIPCYDKEIITQIAKESGFAEEYIKENSEYLDDTGFFGSLGGLDFYEHSNRITIWSAQCKIIRDLAAKGPCVIIGRCADYVLKQEPNVDLLKVFVYADTEFRKKRIVEEYGESKINPEKRIKDKDKRRSAYYEIYTDQKYGDLKNYDLCLNSGRLGDDQCIRTIVDVYKNQTK